MVIHSEQFNGLAICAGNGGFDLGLHLSFGNRYKTVCYVEREAYNAASLVARMEDQALDQAPIWDDLTTFDGRPWRGLVDIVAAGFPCQPHSAAGQKKGMSDDRWLWSYISGTIRQILPGIVWLENVPDLAFSGLATVIGSLTKAGYSSVWDTFTAEETGASHKRERLFVFSYRNGFFDRCQQAEWETWRNIISGGNRSDLRQVLSDSDSISGKTRSERFRRQEGTNSDRSGQESILAIADDPRSGNRCERRRSDRHSGEDVAHSAGFGRRKRRGGGGTK